MYKIVIRLNITYCKLGFAIRVDVNVTFALDFPESKCWPGLHRDLLWIQIMPIDSARVAGNWHPAIACWTCRDCRQESIIFRLEIQFGGWRVQNNLKLWLKCNQEWQFVGILKRSNPIWKEGNINLTLCAQNTNFLKKRLWGSNCLYIEITVSQNCLTIWWGNKTIKVRFENRRYDFIT